MGSNDKHISLYEINYQRKNCYPGKSNGSFLKMKYPSEKNPNNILTFQIFYFDPGAFYVRIQHFFGNVNSKRGSRLNVQLRAKDFLRTDEVELFPELFEAVPSDHEAVIGAVLRLRRDQPDMEDITDLI